MIHDSHRRFLVPFVIVALGVALYVTMLQCAVPHDLSDYYWHAFLTVRAGQIRGLALGTVLYFAGISLCVVAFSSWLPIRSVVLRRLLSVPGLLSTGCGALFVWLVLICFTDKVR